MKDYYEILKINRNASKEEIYKAYNFNISQFNNLPFLTNKMKKTIKNLKEAKYIFYNDNRKNLYDKKINFNKKFNADKDTIDNSKICNRIFSLNFS